MEKNLFNEICPYCNGIGKWNSLAQSYVKNHICQCILLDRNFCPICEKKCHHGSSQAPKCTIDSGHGGMSNVKQKHKEEELVVWGEIMCVCRNTCTSYKAKKPLMSSRYALGQKKCSICDIFIHWEGIFCPCCGQKLRVNPRKKTSKVLLRQ